MIGFQLIVFVLFYVSLIIIIACMYCKYRRECKEMADNEGSEEKFRMVKKLMQVYDTKDRGSFNHHSREILKHEATGGDPSRESLLVRRNTYNRYSTRKGDMHKRDSDFVDRDYAGRNTGGRPMNHPNDDPYAANRQSFQKDSNLEHANNFSHLDNRIDDSFSVLNSENQNNETGNTGGRLPRPNKGVSGSLQDEKNSLLKLATGEENGDRKAHQVGPEDLRSPDLTVRRTVSSELAGEIPSRSSDQLL